MTEQTAATQRSYTNTRMGLLRRFKEAKQLARRHATDQPGMVRDHLEAMEHARRVIETAGGADPETVLFAEGPGGVVVSGPKNRLDTGGEELSLLRLGRVGGTALEIGAGVARLDVQVDELAAAFESGIPDHFQ